MDTLGRGQRQGFGESALHEYSDNKESFSFVLEAPAAAATSHHNFYSSDSLQVLHISKFA
eukprot:COSAG02_NODE_22086_length_763_cov_11.293503_1_plen_59_part_10